MHDDRLLNATITMDKTVDTVMVDTVRVVKWTLNRDRHHEDTMNLNPDHAAGGGYVCVCVCMCVWGVVGVVRGGLCKGWGGGCYL